VRIGLDAREICGKPTGVGRYLTGLLSQWAELPEAGRHQFLLFAPQVPAVSIPCSKFEVRVLPGRNGTRWEQFTLARAVNRARPDVFFAPAYSAPLNVSAPIVLTLHDVSFVAHPEWFRWRERVRRTWLARRSAFKASTVLVDTGQVRDELVTRLRVPAERIRVVPPGVTLPGPSEAGRTFRPASNTILFVGSIFNRRHLPDLIRAFAQIAERHPDARLEIVGENRTHPHQDLEALARSLGMAGRVRIRAYQRDDVLHQLYRDARVFAFLSDYEGFGLPPLEALVAGVPIVVTDTPVAREVCGDAASYVASGDLEGIARSLEAMLFDSQARRHMLDRAPAVLARYSWERAARETLAVLEEAAALHSESRIPDPESQRP
jgi:glycosyltransferase involved in cell wall biosynthesis